MLRRHLQASETSRGASQQMHSLSSPGSSLPNHKGCRLAGARRKPSQAICHPTRTSGKRTMRWPSWCPAEGGLKVQRSCLQVGGAGSC